MAEPTLTLRPLRPSDADHLFWPESLWFLEQWLERQEAGQAYVAVAELDSLPIGRCGVDFEKDPELAWIWAAHVNPEHQSRGVGRALITHLEEVARERGFEAVALGVGKENPRAEALYSRLGYSRYGEETASWQYEKDGRWQTESEECWLMKKPL